MIAIDRFPERLKLARECGAITIDYSHDDVSIVEAVRDLSGGLGPDSCIDCVGIEAHSHSAAGIYDKVKQTLKLETDRSFVLRQAIQAIRKGGTLSITGAYGGVLHEVNFGPAFGKGIYMNIGLTHMHKSLRPLLEQVEQGHIDPSFLISHRIGINQAPEMYSKWQQKEDRVTKIVIDPWRDNIPSPTGARVAQSGSRFAKQRAYLVGPLLSSGTECVRPLPSSYNDSLSRFWAP